MPYPADAAATRAAPADAGGAVNNTTHDQGTSAGVPQPALRATRDYTPLGTLAPTSWTPLVVVGGQVRLGAGAGGSDVLGYHAYSATATWLASTPPGAIKPNEATPDWQLY